jgi:hypothetical protein
MLEKHFGHIPAAARELGVPAPDLRRLTWARPDLLNEALEELELAVIVAQGRVIEALDSPDPRRREWAAEKILGSWMARGHPLAPAGRGRGSGNEGAVVEIKFRWVDDGKLVADK